MELTPQLPKSVNPLCQHNLGFCKTYFKPVETWSRDWSWKQTSDAINGMNFLQQKLVLKQRKEVVFLVNGKKIIIPLWKYRMPVKRRQTWEPMGMSRPWSQWRSYPRGGWGAGRILIKSRPSMIFFNFPAKKLVQHPSENNTGEWSFMWALFRRGCLSC